MVRTISMAGVVYSQKVSNDNIPFGCILRSQKRLQMFNHSVIDGVQIPDIERIVCMCEVRLKVPREQSMPSIISQVDNLLARIPQLRYHIIFIDRRACKIRSYVNEGR